FGENPFFLSAPGHSGLQPKELLFIELRFVALHHLTKEFAFAFLLTLSKPVVFLGYFRRNRKSQYSGVSPHRHRSSLTKLNSTRTLVLRQLRVTSNDASSKNSSRSSRSVASLTYIPARCRRSTAVLRSSRSTRWGELKTKGPRSRTGIGTHALREDVAGGKSCVNY